MKILKNAALQVMRYFLVLCMAVITLLVFSNVVMRYAFNSSIYIAEGISSLLFVWLTFIGAALVLYEKGLIAVDVIVARLPRLYSEICRFIVEIVILAVGLLLLKGSWHQMILNKEVISSSTLLSSAFLYASGVVFSTLSCSYIAVCIFKRVRLLRLSFSELKS
ncbi:TRAP transporter small permease [Halomonas dongshanensis]|uniref:TRAP transporter small permease protein n=1 Tax=Halomonas dongshanensis TaxID=2890835 RepID=A0ABT2E8U9_9GAMM|nr:TRAP transporter small permease [Halomonas dongshanensis]MCS2607996.1 TRAP transporter small permease [Halomonas dongshanensis]